MNKILLALLIVAMTSTGCFAQSSTKAEQNQQHAPVPKAAERDEHSDDEEHVHHNHKTEAAHAHDAHSEKDHTAHSADEKEQEHEEGASASLTPEQLALAGIKVHTLEPQWVDYQLYAPGEVLFNGYTSYRVSPRVASVVVRRHVALGDHVKQGQQLVTLFSSSVAQAQADYRTAYPEWQRVKGLGGKTVGEQRYINAKATLEAAQATLLAYGLSAADLTLLTANDSNNLGQYTLRAEIDGSVLSDEFEQGQRIEAGAPLITLADEQQLWVEAHLPANRSLALPTGTKADVTAGDVRVEAVVTQEAHTIDPITRTRTVRLLIDNSGHRLHPGQFAEVFFRFRTDQPVLAVPESALMRGANGDWTVFVEEKPNAFLAIEVELGRALGHLREISGIAPGSRVVLEGAFFVASQIAKGGFDPHNH